MRETDGTLRSATPEERDRMTRVYKGHQYRPVYEPPLFRDPYLQVTSLGSNTEILHRTILYMHFLQW